MNKCLLFCLLLLPCLLPAQVIRVSDEISIRENQSYFLLDDQRGNVLLFQNQLEQFKVNCFDDQMKQQWEKELELDKKRPEVLDVASVGGDFCVLYTFREKQALRLKAHRYNPGANLVDSLTIKDFGNVFYKPPFQVDYSEDKKVAVIWSVEEDKTISAFAFHLGRMKLLWEKTFSPENMVFSRDFHQLVVDNAGNIYVVLAKENRKARQSEHALQVFHCGGAGTEASVHFFEVKMGDRLTFDAFFSFDNLNQSLVAGGFYATENFLRADGFFYLNVPAGDPAQQLLVFHPFEDDFVSVLLEKEKARNKGVPEVSVQEVVLRRDGGLLLVGEMNKQHLRGGGSSAYYARTGVRPIVDYYYDDVFLISMHPDGAVHWKNILHKKQYSQDDDAAYSSYFLAKTPAALRVIFNDEIKSENSVSEYVVKGDGQFDRNAVLNTAQQDLSLRFRDALQVSATEIVVPSERRSKLKLVRVSY